MIARYNFLQETGSQPGLLFFERILVPVQIMQQ